MKDIRYTIEPTSNGGFLVEISGMGDNNQWSCVKHVFLDRESMFEFISSNL
ncbi:hypothetical protein NVP1264O_41 [Vibrio phage 1.264.O._10N.286.51.F2]|nr:hypothetical protein NVP1264O_41 [Vibrio phage 1.264.O._10N.286.51.F2]